MADTSTTVWTTVPLAGVNFGAKGSTFNFPALTATVGNDGRKHIVAKAVGTLGSTANFTVGAVGSATSAASSGVAQSFNVATAGGVVAGQYFWGRSNFV